MSDRELLALKSKLELLIRRRDEKARRDLVRMVETLKSGRRAGTVNGGEPHPLKGRKLKPKYRNPADRNQTWAGRGNQPRWLKAELKRGKKLSAFLVA